MQFVLLCCFDEARWEEIPEDERNQVMEEYGRLMEDLDRSGQLCSSAKLRPVSTSITVRRVSGDLVTTDGPFAETKEQLGGFHLVDCKNREEAVAIAARIPTLDAGGAVEVRAVE
jgi:hypothetical protein